MLRLTSFPSPFQCWPRIGQFHQKKTLQNNFGRVKSRYQEQCDPRLQLQFCFVLASHIHLDKFDVYLKRILLFVLFLYMILYPHSRQRIGSRDLISFSVWHSKRKQKHGNDTKSINKHIAFHNTSHYTHHGFELNLMRGIDFYSVICNVVYLNNMHYIKKYA